MWFTWVSPPSGELSLGIQKVPSDVMHEIWWFNSFIFYFPSFYFPDAFLHGFASYFPTTFLNLLISSVYSLYFVHTTYSHVYAARIIIDVMTLLWILLLYRFSIRYSSSLACFAFDVCF
jgi:hypothetical protein